MCSPVAEFQPKRQVKICKSQSERGKYANLFPVRLPRRIEQFAALSAPICALNSEVTANMKMTVPSCPDPQQWTPNTWLRCGHFSKVRCLGLLLCALALFLLTNRNCSADDDGPSKASKEISLKNFGYEGLAPMARFTTQHDLTINFIDDNHLLLTYNPKKLIERHPECPPSHKDHMIEAQVLDLSSGNVVREASWYVHDEHGYLWPLGQGHFVLRILNSLYMLDRNLQQRMLLQSPADI